MEFASVGILELVRQGKISPFEIAPWAARLHQVAIRVGRTAWSSSNTKGKKKPEPKSKKSNDQAEQRAEKSGSLSGLRKFARFTGASVPDNIKRWNDVVKGDGKTPAYFAVQSAGLDTMRQYTVDQQWTDTNGTFIVTDSQDKTRTDKVNDLYEAVGLDEKERKAARQWFPHLGRGRTPEPAPNLGSGSAPKRGGEKGKSSRNSRTESSRTSGDDSLMGDRTTLLVEPERGQPLPTLPAASGYGQQ